MSFLARRQKLIKLADHSESGWAIVEEYNADALADDERKIEKAKQAAEWRSWLSGERCRRGDKKQWWPGAMAQRP